LSEQIHTRRTLAAQLRTIGLGAGDSVMVHAALRSVGRILGGPDALIEALHDAIGPRVKTLSKCGDF